MTFVQLWEHKADKLYPEVFFINEYPGTYTLTLTLVLTLQVISFGDFFVAIATV